MTNKILNKNNHKYVSYKLSSAHGSITHYYHFFYGVFIPLILEYIEYKKKYEFVTFIINDDISPFFRILFELPIDIKLQCFFKDYNILNIEKKKFDSIRYTIK